MAPGTYRAALTIDGVEVAGSSQVFSLEEAPPETPSDGEESPSADAG